MLLIDLWQDLLHLFYPHLCPVCASTLPTKTHLICPRCISRLPRTFDENARENPTEKIFTGRIRIDHAWSAFYFHKGSAMQLLIHELKYNNAPSLGYFLGELMGMQMLEAKMELNIDGLLPLPMHKKKEKQRGYNQALLIAKGISSVTGIPVIEDAVIKTKSTSTQTNKQRIERWKNASGNFSIVKPEQLQHKNLLLVDDVITTGATLEACGSLLSKLPGTRLSIATLARAA